eukprot:jgi/Astpho2/4397/gw1.00067.294.1_t
MRQALGQTGLGCLSMSGGRPACRSALRVWRQRTSGRRTGS